MLLVLLGEEYEDGVLQPLRGSAAFRNFVEALGGIAALGLHALSATPKLLSVLAAWPGVGARARIALMEVARAAVYGSVSHADVSDAIVFGGPGAPSAASSSVGVKWHRRDWQWLSTLGELRETVLLCENDIDAEWYDWIGRAHAASIQASTSATTQQLRFRARGGGDSTTAGALTREANGPQPVLCVVDTDRDHPTAPLGGTARAARKAANVVIRNNHLSPAHVEELPARNVENLLPASLAGTVFANAVGWLGPTVLRGLLTTTSIEPKVAFLNLGRSQCEHLLRICVVAKTKQYRSDAIAFIRQKDPKAPNVDACLTHSQASPGRCCDLKDKDNKPVVPQSCALIQGIGKPMKAVVAILNGELAKPMHSRGTPSVAHWLASQLPTDAASVGLRRRIWSWGLATAPRIRSGPQTAKMRAAGRTRSPKAAT